MPDQDPFAAYRKPAETGDPFAAFRVKTPQAPPDPNAHVTMQDLAAEGPSAMRATKGEGFKATAKFAGEHPAAMGSAYATAASAPFTAGLSLVPGMIAEGLIGAGGAGGGHAVKAAVTGDVPSAREVGSDMLSAGLWNAGGVGVLRGVPAAISVMKSPVQSATHAAEVANMLGVPGAGPAASALRLFQRLRGAAAEAAPAAANTGGRLVTGTKQPIESVIGDALEQARAPVKPDVITLPPEPRLPAGYTPRTSVPEPTPVHGPAPSPNAGGRLTTPTRPAAVPPTANAKQAIDEALTELTQPAAPKSAPMRLGTPKPQSAQELPASWQRLTKPPAAPVRDAAPLGLSDHAPLWSRGEALANDARDMRGAMGAEDAGALMDMPADDVRALSGAPKRRPLVADLADLDRGYSRQLANPLAGVALGVPTADVLRRALIEALSKHGAPSPQ